MRIGVIFVDTPHTWPSMVRIRQRLPYYRHEHVCRTQHCGLGAGVILSTNFVLTTRSQCHSRYTIYINKMNRDQLVRPTDMSVAVGAHYDISCAYSELCNEYKGTYKNTTGSIVSVRKIIVRRKLCLIKVDDMPLENKIVTAAVLPSIHIGDVPMNPKCFAVGWGATSSGKYAKQSPVILSTMINVINTGSCTNSTHPVYKHVNSLYNFCAGTVSGHDVCEDDGSPVICIVDDLQVVYGILSNGPRRCGNKRGNLPRIYSTVAKSFSWIRQYVPDGKIIPFQPTTNTIPGFSRTCTQEENFGGKRIIGGANAGPHSWPWLVAFSFYDDRTEADRCGGTIISNHAILTAAHCCKEVLDRAYNVTALFGTDDRRNPTTNGGYSETIDRENLIINDYYNPRGGPHQYNNDICVVLTPFDIIERANANPDCKRNSCVQIACVPTERVRDGAACWTAGWGLTGRSRYSISPTLKQIGVNVIGTDYCKTHVKTSGRYTRYQKLQPEEICAGIPDRDHNGLLDAGVDSCGGDSGGPLICKIDGLPTLVGVTSWGHPNCGTEGSAGVYSGVYTQYDWIYAQIVDVNECNTQNPCPIGTQCVDEIIGFSCN